MAESHFSPGESVGSNTGCAGVGAFHGILEAVGISGAIGIDYVAGIPGCGCTIHLGHFIL